MSGWEVVAAALVILLLILLVIALGLGVCFSYEIIADIIRMKRTGRTD